VNGRRHRGIASEGAAHCGRDRWRGPARGNRPRQRRQRRAASQRITRPPARRDYSWGDRTAGDRTAPLHRGCGADRRRPPRWRRDPHDARAPRQTRQPAPRQVTLPARITPQTVAARDPWGGPSRCPTARVAARRGSPGMSGSSTCGARCGHRRTGTDANPRPRCPARAGARSGNAPGRPRRRPCGDDRTRRRHRPSAAAPLEGTGIRRLSGWRRQAFRSCRRPGRRPCKRPRCRSPCSFQ